MLRAIFLAPGDFQENRSVFLKEIGRKFQHFPFVTGGYMKFGKLYPWRRLLFDNTKF